MPAQPPGPLDPGPRLTRRRLLQLGLALPLPLVVAACDDDSPAGRADPAAAPTTAAPPATTAAPGGTLAPTPACDDGDDPTPEQTEGPYFTPNSPRRASLLEAGLGGQRLVIAGTVLATDCRPVAGALLDFWQADDAGEYDNQGYRLRGHQFSDARGAWRLETVVPGRYTGRTRHIHVKVQAPDRPVLTTQLYFPGEPENDRDGIFQPELLLGDVRNQGSTRRARFTFVLAV
jgi:protocatechuate 3,4-dioxygenase beta subunit